MRSCSNAYVFREEAIYATFAQESINSSNKRYTLSYSTRKLQDVLAEFCGSNTTPSGVPKYHPDGVSHIKINPYLSP
ncbi:hypothetical protein ALC53_03156 [Atta colombica]|uniref:Uncharacterized protein n=1 Tax=Atta colombica TaxID=520822 RepID=A0A195BRV3_9HYME|nr:hypothetical protein ALC53_03156 [Atta colombica]